MKKNIKKYLALMLAVVMAFSALTLVACNPNSLGKDTDHQPLRNVKGVEDGVYYYLPVEHAIRLVKVLDNDMKSQLDTVAEWGANIEQENINIIMFYVYNLYHNSRKYLDNSDVITRFDGCTTAENMAKICDIISPYCCVVGGLGKLNVSFMRNLNRALIEISKPLSLALIDGPFTSVFTIKPPETGCFECMEQRVFARMEDHPVYRKFVEETRDKFIDSSKVYYTPLLSSVVSTAIFEGLTISAVGKPKFAGRVLNTYVPVMEMQVEDILRIPYCPACGTIAKAQIDEMYTSSKKLVDTVLDNIELV